MNFPNNPVRARAEYINVKYMHFIVEIDVSANQRRKNTEWWLIENITNPSYIVRFCFLQHKIIVTDTKKKHKNNSHA